VSGSAAPESQPQRTALAWTRTGIGCAGLGLVLGRHAIITGRPVDVAAAVLVGVAAVAVLVLGRRRRDQIAGRVAAGQTPAVPRGVAAVTVLIAGTALLVIGSILGDGLR
jgi:putative membrane protein